MITTVAVVALLMAVSTDGWKAVAALVVAGALSLALVLT